MQRPAHAVSPVAPTLPVTFPAEKFGYTDFTPINISQPGQPKVVAEAPPYNGYGEEEDSLGSWKYLVLKVAPDSHARPIPRV